MKRKSAAGERRHLKNCSICGEHKTYEQFEITSTTANKIHRRNACRACRKVSRASEKSLKKLHGSTKPIGTPCDCCGRTTSKLSLDHDHETDELRGWLCQTCNVAIGSLGDNIEGVARALDYLKRAKGGGESKE